MTNLPVWRWPYHWPRQNLSEMLREIVAGTFNETYRSRYRCPMWELRREILIQCREEGLCSFNGEDCNVHLVPIEGLTIIPQPEVQRRGH